MSVLRARIGCGNTVCREVVTVAIEDAEPTYSFVEAAAWIERHLGAIGWEFRRVELMGEIEIAYLCPRCASHLRHGGEY